MITSWRITTTEYAQSVFDGEGTRLYGGRWNSVGVAAVYTASSAALAALELLVRIRRHRMLRKYVLFACTFDERLIEKVDRAALPDGWRRHPAPPGLQHVGDRWIGEARSAVLEVPSAIIETESNFLLNPAHPDFKAITTEEPIPFSLDLRLIRE